MLGLVGETDPAWVAVALSDPGRLLQDHAHCERKAAATARSIADRHPEHPELKEPLEALAREEASHFALVQAELRRRGLSLGPCEPDPYAVALRRLVAPAGEARLRDLLLVGSLIEARSCERFHLLAEHCPDVRLRRLWGGLRAAEAGHHALFVRLAGGLSGPGPVRERLCELRAREGEIVRRLPLRAAIH